VLEMVMYLLYHVLEKYRAGVIIQKKNTKPAATFASAHHGVARGEPM
jgi:hypothetical protein